MKATLDIENYSIELDRDAIKAIRFCYGLNPNLRVRINPKQISRDRLWNWLDENGYHLFGANYFHVRAEYGSENYPKFERMLFKVVSQVFIGKPASEIDFHEYHYDKEDA